MDLREEIIEVLDQILDQVTYEKGDIFVIGCSTSEVVGGTIGKDSNQDTGKLIFETINDYLSGKMLNVAYQCCEHLNRALVVEKELAKEKGLEIVSVVPKTKAGGSLATAAYEGLVNPVVVEFINGNIGLDIGDTFIGMHIKHVCVPLRIEKKSIGHAHISQCYSRPKLIGGKRAEYN